MVEWFQSTRPHEGRDTEIPRPPAPSSRFNPRAPTRGATNPVARIHLGTLVSIHAPPRGARLSLLASLYTISWFQSTRPHEGRDSLPRRPCPPRYCFNPRAPTRGATRRGGAEFKKRWGFNPRAPTRGATSHRPRRVAQSHVSIHAPPRGARLSRAGCIRWCWRFNPRAPTRGATTKAVVGCLYRVFQSTRPHEGRDLLKRLKRASQHLVCFNPRAPTRGATRI